MRRCSWVRGDGALWRGLQLNHLRATGEDTEGHGGTSPYSTNIHGRSCWAVQGSEKIESRQKGSRSRRVSTPGPPGTLCDFGQAIFPSLHLSFLLCKMRVNQIRSSQCLLQGAPGFHELLIAIHGKEFWRHKLQGILLEIHISTVKVLPWRNWFNWFKLLFIFLTTGLFWVQISRTFSPDTNVLETEGSFLL